MIYGIGIDLISITRMEQAWVRHGVRLAARILADAEMAEFEALTFDNDYKRARWLAKRWAAKEALAKATGLGMRPPVGFRAMAVRHSGEGRPGWVFNGELQKWMSERELKAHLSISDERDMVVAQVVLEG